MNSKINLPLLSFFLLFTFVGASFSEVKIVYIDMQKVMNISKAGKSITSQLENKHKENLNNFKKEEETLKSEESKIVSQKKIIEKEEYQKKINELRVKVKKYREKRTNVINQLTKQRVEATKKLLDTINPILDILLIEFFGTTFLKEFYLEKENIKIMDKSGMTFGYHGHSHTPFSMLNKNELGNEIAIEKQFFSSIGVYAKSISHPYGDAASVNNENLEVIHKNHIKLGFMAEDFEYNSDLQMGRIDCKEILDNNFY